MRTTFVPALQREAERAITQGLAKFRQAGLQAALVAIDPHTGDVLALVGGRDFRRTPFNRAVGAKRQPGSAFKPFLYAAALQSGMSPISPVSNLTDLRVPGYDEWEIRNASIDTRDTLTLREALYESNNQAAVKLQTQVGSRPVIRMAEAVGLPQMPDVPSLALGVGESTPMQLTAAYAVFPNGGFAVSPRPIVQVLDSDGYAVFNREVQRRSVISEAVAYQMVSMLADVVDVGTGAAVRSLGVRFPVAGKTGTTDDFKDAWFVGFSSTLVAGVWVGFDKPASIGADGYGARYALPIWADFMSKTARVTGNPRSSACRRRSTAHGCAGSAICCPGIRARPTRSTSNTGTWFPRTGATCTADPARQRSSAASFQRLERGSEESSGANATNPESGTSTYARSRRRAFRKRSKTIC